MYPAVKRVAQRGCSPISRNDLYFLCGDVSGLVGTYGGPLGIVMPIWNRYLRTLPDMTNCRDAECHGKDDGAPFVRGIDEETPWD